MIQIEERIQALAKLGSRLRRELEHWTDPEQEVLRSTVALAFHKNGWFTEPEVKHALAYWSEELTEPKLTAWASKYSDQPEASLHIGLVLAGNIPLVGFHDVLSVFISGHKAIIKLSSSDPILIPYLLEILIEEHADAKNWFEFSEEKLKDYDAVIATGSNNSARHFEQYFQNVPHIIRRNRTSVTVLNGNETEAELEELMADILRYYGLGCRSVTKLYIPDNFDINKIFKASLAFAYVMDNKKYANNYNYHKTLMLMERRNVLENDVILMVEEASLFSPVSVINYERYSSIEVLSIDLDKKKEDIQCIVGQDTIGFGKAQKPSLEDYADGIDTLLFLQNLQAKKASK